MRDHIRREAADFNASWWLVPVVFATAALVAVATIDPATPQEAAAPQAVPQAAAPSVAAQPQPRPEPSAVEVTEHVQAF
ncbi:MAG TPA: hypothetical protein VGD76_06105 [Ramlibacter sp.]